VRIPWTLASRRLRACCAKRIGNSANWELHTALERVQPHKYYVIVVFEAST